jgi:hypothetical protein
MSSSGETSLKAELALPQKMAEACCRFLPVISTREPSGPLVGEMRRISGWDDCAITLVDSVETNAPQTIAAIVVRFPRCINRARTGEDARAYII